MASLSDRLRRLRSASPEPPAPEGPPGGAESEGSDAGARPSLAERLRCLDPVRRRTPSRQAPDESALADALGAEIVAPGVLRLQRRWPLVRRHGRCGLKDCAAAMPYLLAPAADSAQGSSTAPAATTAASLATTSPATWAFIDTETSGLAGGTGTWVFVCGIARLCGDALLLRQWLLTRLDAEASMLRLLAEELVQTSLLISYNGKGFDLPLLTTRFRLAAGPDTPVPALDAIAHLDLLYPVRRSFARCWPDCRLSSVEQRLLGFTRIDDMPGAEAPAAWLDWLRRGDGGRLGAVLRHNRLDLISLAALVPALVRVEQEPAAHGADVGAIARGRLQRGDAVGARILLQSAAPTLPSADLLLLATLYRRSGLWPQALSLWNRLAAADEPAALEALAKYYEHRQHDPRQAMVFARRLPAGPERTRRCDRLGKKVRHQVSLPLL
ncbi:hypothetical protein F2Q65_03510 [Thiohalocapsa marina]|uniref:YprB ribonuclease H-like domain-containing protein n=1 Tax=Thiohalocapsa marina TaxID=424902 RepID=A0A5M8FT46_9GAMM|nr:ribonuclease H-like domain-containing protein [Thiohalocapsa marina]KAA6186968.1 hypothetical protein F2Q65_03510 [Thiohalocapsa marina]